MHTLFSFRVLVGLGSKMDSVVCVGPRARTRCENARVISLEIGFSNMYSGPYDRHGNVVADESTRLMQLAVFSNSGFRVYLTFGVGF